MKKTTGFISLLILSTLSIAAVARADSPVHFDTKREFFRFIASNYTRGFSDKNQDDAAVKAEFKDTERDELLYKLALDTDVRQRKALPKGMVLLLHAEYHVPPKGENLIKGDAKDVDYYLAAETPTGMELLGRMRGHNDCKMKAESMEEITCICTTTDGNFDRVDTYTWDGKFFEKEGGSKVKTKALKKIR